MSYYFQTVPRDRGGSLSVEIKFHLYRIQFSKEWESTPKVPHLHKTQQNATKSCLLRKDINIELLLAHLLLRGLFGRFRRLLAVHFASLTQSHS